MIPREFFPNMPDEVFEMWLEPIAEDYGWPFKNTSDCTKETKWSGVFGRYELYDWAAAGWARTEIKIHTETLTDSTCFRLNSIIQRCVEGLPTLLANVEGSEERFRACADFIRTNGTIPKPIAAIVRGKQIEIVDGYHRIAALLHVGPPQIFIVPAWIASMEQEHV